MQYVVETHKPVAQAAADFQAAVEAAGFGVLHVYDLRETLRNKGFDLPNECRIFEICNPQQAINVLEYDMGMNLALPCRVSVYEEAGKTKIGMIRPTALLDLLSDGPDLESVAEEVETAIVRMMQDARR